MKVYLDSGHDMQLIGHSNVPDDVGRTYMARQSGPGFARSQQFTIGTVTHPAEGGGAAAVERVVLASPRHLVELLPGWKPLAS